MSIGDRLKEARETAKKTQEETARFLGFTHANAYQKYEYNQREPSIDKIKALAGFFGVSVGFLMEAEDNNAK